MSQDNLRNEAEKIISQQSGNDNRFSSDLDKTIHELNVYQIELELQNEELKRTSEELAKSHKRFTDLFEHAPVGYFLLTSQSVIIDVNQSASSMLRLTKEQIISKQFTKYIDPDFQDTFHFLTQKVEKSDELVIDELKIRPPEGDGFFAQLQCIRDIDTSTKLQYYRLAIINISARKIIEKKLKRFRAALDSTADNIFIMDFETARFIDVNDAVCRNIGFSRDEFLSMTPQDINPTYSSEIFMDLRHKHLKEINSNVTLEMQYQTKSGALIDVEVFLKTVQIEDEKLIVAVARDITERKKNQDKLAQYAKELEDLNKGKDKFLSIISHDLRGPFLGLKGYTQMIIEEYDFLEKEEIMDYLEKIHNSSKDLYTLVDNLLKWSRLELGKIPYEPMPFNLYAELESVIKLLAGIAAKKEITIENDIDEDIYPFADRIMLISIMQNLVGNAIKFTRRNGLIRIFSRLKPDYVEVCVEDNGIGMTREVFERLFTIDKGHTSRGTEGEKGTGFGLIIAKEMVKRMGGTIKVESESGKGTIFTFTLQLSDLTAT